MLRISIVGGVMILLSGSIVVSGAAPQKAHQVPCVRANWMWAGDVEELAVGESRVYTISGDFVTALSVEKGEVLWEHDYGTGSNPPVTLIAEMAGTLVVTRGRRLLLIDPQDGKLKHSIELPGEIETIEGPPLVAEVASGKNRELVSIDLATGKELAQCGKTCRPELAEFGVFNGVVVAILGRDSKKVIGLQPADFKQLWQFEHERPLSLACSEMGPAFLEGTRNEPEGFYLFDTATGARSIKLPAREDGSSVMAWNDTCRREMTQSLDFSIRSTAELDACSIARFTGTIAEPTWTAELEGHLDKLVSDGANTYAVTHPTRKPDAGNRWPLQLFYVLEKSTGRVLRRAVSPFSFSGSVPFVLANRNSSIISMSGINGVTIVFSISVKELDPPTALPGLVDRLLDLAGT